MYLAAIALALQFVVLRVCAQNAAMWHRRAYFRLAALIWCAMPIAKVCYIDQLVPPTDGLGHEMIAREIADLLTDGRYAEAAGYFAVGNNAYRALLGVFYAITAAPEIVTYSINGALGFMGLLALLDVLCRHSNCRRLPLSAVLTVSLLPSGLIWTTANLKEGAMLWGICMMLYLTVPTASLGPRPRRLLPILGFLTVGVLRPHIAVAWLGAIGAGAAVDKGRIGLLFGSAAAGLVGFVLIGYLAPDLFATAMKDGVTTTLSDRYNTLASNDRVNGAALTGNNPIPVVSGLSLLMFRPWPLEVDGLSELLVGVEMWGLAVIGFWNWKSIRGRRRLLLRPALITQFAVLLAFGYFFTYMYNMGLAVRQRLMCLPAILFIYFYPLLLRQPARIRATMYRQRPRQTVRHWAANPKSRLAS
jgi:hypothetical protein